MYHIKLSTLTWQCPLHVGYAEVASVCAHTAWHDRAGCGRSNIAGPDTATDSC